MGIMLQPGRALVIGYHNEETEFGLGFQLTSDGNVLIGSWYGQNPWDMDLYHSNKKRENLYSQIRHGLQVKKDKIVICKLEEN